MSVEKISNSRSGQLEMAVGESDQKQSSTEVLPKASKSFCFTAEDFADDSFSIDSFLKTSRSKVTLEQLKDDLNSYLKLLKISMVELINEDYNDFINLTTNLMGFDKSINNLSQPLVKLRDQSSELEHQFSQLIRQLENQKTRLQYIRRNKNQMNKIINVMNCIDKAEHWFNCYRIVDSSADSIIKDLSSLEKIGLVINRIEMLMKSIESDIPLVRQQIVPRFQVISDNFYQTLETEFFSSISDNKREELNTILRIYSLNGKQSELEALFRQKVVKPYMDEVICETFLEKYGINRFFEDILKFIDLKCQLIIDVNDSDFSFIINSVWSEVCNCIVIRTTSVFSAGNPDQFHRQYYSTIEFINSFVEKSGIKRSDLEQKSNYKELMNKFNIEVYFHIRFQQIATKFESFIRENTFDVNTDPKSKFNFLVTIKLFECLSTCWSPETVYISDLFGSFWKLTLQLLSRYWFWLRNLNDSDFKSTNESNQQHNRSPNKLFLLGLLINDCENVINESISFFESKIIVLKPENVLPEVLRQSFNETIEALKTNGLSNVVILIKSCLITQCDSILRQVIDLPRLYRKTNKEVPTKASNYVYNCIDLIASVVLSETQVWKNEWTTEILNEITAHFKYFTSEVLTSVQKIEDSLKRLKKSKIGNQNNQMRKIPSNMSDDDKIRLQISYDVEEYGKLV